MPTASHAKISDTFNQIHAAQSMTVSKSTVHRWLQADRYLILQMRRELKHRRPYPVAPNAVWGMDMTGKADTKGTIHTILACVDHGTRKCTALEILQNKNSWTLLGHLFLAIGQFGKPRAIRTDNEPCFTSHVFTTVLRLADIKHQRTEPGCPWQNGHIERFFCTLKQKLNMIRPTSKAVLENLLKEFHFWYDAVRPHQHLNGATPQQIWDGINPWSTPVKEERLFIGWEGMLTGFWLRR
jgi:transposase InsO family protein